MYRIGYLGPKGTFSEEAACLYMGRREGEMTGCSSLEEIFTGVADGRLDEGIVPVENSTEGAVGAVLDLLAGPFDLAVRREVVLPVCQSLMVRPGVKLEQVERVFSHSQPFAQCRNFLRKELPAALLTECSSTAAAAVQVAASDRPWAALGPQRAAAEYGLQVVVPTANDCPDNVTRFWVVGREQLSCSIEHGYKTSLIFGVGDRPGALYAVLREFSIREINLTRIESRPAKKNLGDYLFFIDFMGGQSRPEVQEALREVASITLGLKILGSYPEWDHAGSRTSGQESSVTGVTLTTLRHELDELDAQMVDLLVRRTRLVDRVAQLKQGKRDIRDPARENQILSRVHQISLARGGDPKLAEEVWRVILDHSVYRQKDQLTSGAANKNH
ncbi:MAG: prephenate dehydratase [Desulfotomaculaceae bacterium]